MQLKEKIKYLFYFYWFLIRKKGKDFWTFFIITFIFSLFPYGIVLYEIIKLPEINQKQFFGDGSIIILCAAILCSYFAILFDFRNKEEKQLNVLLNLFLVLFYVIVIFIFYKCQLNFDRDWNFIYGVWIITIAIFMITLLSAIYLNFRVNINYSEVQNYMDNIQKERIEKKAKRIKKKSKSDPEI